MGLPDEEDVCSDAGFLCFDERTGATALAEDADADGSQGAEGLDQSAFGVRAGALLWPEWRGGPDCDRTRSGHNEVAGLSGGDGTGRVRDAVRLPVAGVLQILP